MWRRAGSVLHLTPRQVKLDVVLSNGLQRKSSGDVSGYGGNGLSTAAAF